MSIGMPEQSNFKMELNLGNFKLMNWEKISQLFFFFFLIGSINTSLLN